VLEEIPGIGEGRKRALLRHFGALKRVREASLDEVTQVDGFGPKQARAVFEFFHRPEPVEAEPAAATLAEGLAAEPVSEEDIDAALADEAQGG
jgi:excinuclease ABC subunit C